MEKASPPSAMDSLVVAGECSRPARLTVSDLEHLFHHKSVEKVGSEPGENLKRKATDSPAMDCEDLIEEESLVGSEEYSRRISREIDDLRSHLAGKMKELEYCEDIKKLRTELALKAKEMESLKKQNEELQANSGSSQKNPLELEVTQLNDTIQLMKEDDEYKEEFMGKLVEKERQCNYELQQARKELIMGLQEMQTGQTTIGIKRMGEVDEKLFQVACRRKHENDYSKIEATVLACHWQEKIRKPSWHPFKIVMVDGKEKEVLDDDDAELQRLMVGYGDEVCNAVKTAMCELNEYNASGRYPVPELWNFSIGRRATTQEAVQFVLRRMKKLTSKRRLV